MTLDTSTTSLTTSRLRSLTGSFSGKHVLVIGDMVADEYLIGRPTRIAREAPVLILELSEERIVPGGATNVAVNACTLGAEVFLAGVVGDDIPGQSLRRAISELGMHQEGLVTDSSRPTSTKTRIVAASSQIVQQHTGGIFRLGNLGGGGARKRTDLDYKTYVFALSDEVIM